jgi:type I restriction enzyme S subunit
MATSQEHITRDRLDHLCLLVTDGTHDSPTLQPSGVPFIKGKHISGGFVDFDNCDYITFKDHIKAIQRSKPEYGNILFSNIGSVGDAAYINTQSEFSIKNVALFKPDPRVVNSKYLYYVVIGPKFRGGPH